MPIELSLVRHGETDANAASIWQGQGDASLSDIGRAQAEALRKRLGDVDFDLVISSDLARALETAELAGLDPEPDPAWREMDIGIWEGLTREEVQARHGDELRRMASGDRDVRMGGGESWNEFSARIDRAVADVMARAEAGNRVLIIAHGGVIHSALSSRLGFRGASPWPIARILNAAVTEVVLDDSFAHLQVLNDVRHVAVATGHEEARGFALALVRHGESEGNVAGRWQGRTDGPLTERGLRQGAELAGRYDGVTRVIASPLERARLTAVAFAGQHGLDVSIEPDLVEIDFGSWEDMTTSEISDTFPEQWNRIFEHGIDEPRGGSGETFEGAGLRMARAVRRIADDHPTERLALFSHAGAIWAFAAKILGFGWSGWRKLAIPANASVTHVRYDGGHPVLIDYNVPL